MATALTIDCTIAVIIAANVTIVAVTVLIVFIVLGYLGLHGLHNLKESPWLQRSDLVWLPMLRSAQDTKVAWEANFTSIGRAACPAGQLHARRPTNASSSLLLTYWTNRGVPVFKIDILDGSGRSGAGPVFKIDILEG